jgi:metallo-beta-lactamase class B
MKQFMVMALAALVGCATPSAPLATDAEIEAAQNAPLNGYAINGRWNEPYEPFTVIGNIHYVGTAGVSAFLITTPEGHFLLDGILPQSVPQIAANIRALGYDVRDVKYLLNSHAHFDHAGGLAGLQRLSGATMVASAADKPVLEAGDISYGPSSGMRFPPVRVDRVIDDNESLSLGGVRLTAHLTPGHTEGCTSWSMDVTGADGARHAAFFHCSVTVAGQSLAPEAYPGMIDAFRSTFARVREMRADVFLGNHENFFDLDARRQRQRAGDPNAFVDAEALGAFNAALEAAFEAELVRQQAAAR